MTIILAILGWSLIIGCPIILAWDLIKRLSKGENESNVLYFMCAIYNLAFVVSTITFIVFLYTHHLKIDIVPNN